MPSPKRPIGSAANRPAKLFVDSGAWFALRSRRDQHHAETDRLFREAIRQHIPLLTTNLIIAEVHRLTLHRAGIEAAAKVLDRIGASSSVTVHYATADDHSSALRWLEKLRGRPTTYTDAVSFSVMNARACTSVLGFDGDFAAAGFSIWRGR